MEQSRWLKTFADARLREKMPITLLRCPVHQSLYIEAHGCYGCRLEDSEQPVEYIKDKGKLPRGTIKPLRGEHLEYY